LATKLKSPAILLVFVFIAACAARPNTAGLTLVAPDPAAVVAAPEVADPGTDAIVVPQPVEAAVPQLAKQPQVAEVAGVVEPQGGWGAGSIATERLPEAAFGILSQQQPDTGLSGSAGDGAGSDSAGAALRMSVPFHSQKDGDRFQGSNCGPATLGMVLDAFGMQYSNPDLRLLTHTYQGTVGARTGTALQHMAHVAADFGLEPRGLYQRPDGTYAKDGFARWTVDDVRSEVLAGRPVIPLVKFRLLPGHEDSPFRADHYVVIHGVDGDQFLYHDPIYDSAWEGAGRWMSAETLAAAMRPTLVPQQAVSFGPGTHAALPAS